jgi:UDP-3-O-acyl-N-acetylglucosamine deacetylase
LFTAAPASLRMLPAEPGSGIVFVRSDLSGSPRIPATFGFLSTRPMVPAFTRLPPRHTVVASRDDDRACVATIEHVLAALSGLGVADAILEVDGPEVPHADGSAEPFCALARSAGLVESAAIRAELILPREISVQRDDATITARPRIAPGASYAYQLAYPEGSPIRPAVATWHAGEDSSSETFLRQVAPARTFCLESEARAMRALGLLTHLSPGDALVYGADGPIGNAERLPDEPARHKLLDLIGDLALLGRPLRADIHASRSGHALAHELCGAILAATA